MHLRFAVCNRLFRRKRFQRVGRDINRRADAQPRVIHAAHAVAAAGHYAAAARDISAAVLFLPAVGAQPPLCVAGTILLALPRALRDGLESGLQRR